MEQLEGGAVLTVNGHQLQVVQMNNTAPTAHVVQGPNGQHIVVPAMASGANTIQLATPNGQQLQQVQVVPLSALQGASTSQPMQLVQTADGQTFLYQPTVAQPALDQHQILHQPTVLNLNGNLVQVAGVGNAVQQQIVNQPNIVMMVNNNQSTASAQSTSSEAAGNDDDEPLLYVNARQFKRILKRREARTKLHQMGKIPKERPKYLHESRHRHAMNRIRGEHGRFHSGTRKGKEQQDNMSDVLEDIKTGDVSITIIHEEEDKNPQPNQWRKLAPQPESKHVTVDYAQDTKIVPVDFVSC